MTVSHSDFMKAIAVYETAMNRRDSLNFSEALALFEEAQEELSKLEIEISPALKIAFAYDMALACDLAGQTERAHHSFRSASRMYESLKNQNPTDPAVEGLDGLIWGINDYLKLWQDLSPDADNYLDSIVARTWAEDKMPLFIWVDDSDDTGFDTKLKSIILDGFSAWTSKPSSMRWLQTDDRSLARITVTRTGELGSAGGHTAFEEQTDAGGEHNLHSVTIRIAVPSKQSHTYTEPQLQALRSLCIHEAGHALGLDGHSPYATDLMYWKSPLLEPSSRDFKTFQLLYP